MTTCYAHRGKADRPVSFLPVFSDHPDIRTGPPLRFGRSCRKTGLPPFLVLASLSVLLGFVTACGRKADPLPPQLVRPKPITNLVGQIDGKKVKLEWTRPSKYTGGRRMDDLGGFLVFRGQLGLLAEKVAEIPVEDQHRFQRQKKFEWADDGLEAGKWYYRVVSFTTDLYYSDPSNQVDVEIEE